MTKLGTAFAQNLRRLREKAGISQEEVARQAHLTNGYVSMLERGVRGPSFDVVEVLAKVFDVNPLNMLKEK
jgi:transcriptional regulator with XRE-family HTH domain